MFFSRLKGRRKNRQNGRTHRRTQGRPGHLQRIRRRPTERPPRHHLDRDRDGNKLDNSPGIFSRSSERRDCLPYYSNRPTRRQPPTASQPCAEHERQRRKRKRAATAPPPVSSCQGFLAEDAPLSYPLLPSHLPWNPLSALHSISFQTHPISFPPPNLEPLPYYPFSLSSLRATS